MKWTVDKPTENGLYWCKEYVYGSEGWTYTDPGIVHIDGISVWWIGSEQNSDLRDLHFDKCMWFGPLQPPEEP